MPSCLVPASINGDSSSADTFLPPESWTLFGPTEPLQTEGTGSRWETPADPGRKGVPLRLVLKWKGTGGSQQRIHLQQPVKKILWRFDLPLPCDGLCARFASASDGRFGWCLRENVIVPQISLSKSGSSGGLISVKDIFVAAVFPSATVTEPNVSRLQQQTATLHLVAAVTY